MLSKLASSMRSADRRMLLIIAVMLAVWLVVILSRHTLRARWWTHKLLTVEDRAARLIYFERLVALGPRGAAGVEALLSSDDPALRGLGMALVNHTKPPKARELLVRMADDPDLEVADMAVTGLALLGDPEVVHDLERLLQVPEPNRAVIAVTGLGRLRTPEAIDLLIETARSHPVVAARVQAIEELGQLQVERAVEVLGACLADDTPFDGLTVSERSAEHLLAHALPGEGAAPPTGPRPVSHFAERGLRAITGERVSTNGPAVSSN